MQCSVVIPAFNAADTILGTLQSVLRNLDTNDEILVIDDGSVDETARICTGIDHRIRVITINNGGPAKARNKGIELSRTELVAFCDADDLWHSNKLSSQRQCFMDMPELGLCCTDYQVVDPQERILTASAIKDRNLPATHTLASMLETNPVLTSSAVARHSALTEVGGFPDTWNEALQIHLAGEDYEAWIAIAEHHQVAMVPEVLVSYRQMPDGMFIRSVGNYAASRQLLRRRVSLIQQTAKRNPDKVDAAQARRAVSETYFRAAYKSRQDGHFLDSAKLTFQSLANDPTRRKAWLTFALMPAMALRHMVKRLSP